MADFSRRQALRLLGAGGAALFCWPGRAAAAWINSLVRGVEIGAQSYSFRDRPLDAAIVSYSQVGLGDAELWQGHVEPAHVNRTVLREWRLRAPLSLFVAIRHRFDRAGVRLFAYNYSFRRDFSDAEIERGFAMARALGVGVITASANVSVAPRVDRFAQQYRIHVGFHNHDDTADPDEFSTPATFARALKGASSYLGINLDIGHFVAANCDPVDYLQRMHDRILVLHLKDRKRNHGSNMPWGEGDTPIGAVLRLLRDHRWPIPANIEYEYGRPGLNTIVEMRKCYAFCRHALLV